MEQEDIIIKYPRTPHIQGSRLQPGDEDLRQRPFSDIAGKHVVLEEKIDGANSAISFTDDGELRLQSRGHFLMGGYRERPTRPGKLNGILYKQIDSWLLFALILHKQLKKDARYRKNYTDWNSRHCTCIWWCQRKNDVITTSSLCMV